jgi:hypothetical protein
MVQPHYWPTTRATEIHRCRLVRRWCSPWLLSFDAQCAVCFQVTFGVALA